MTTVEQNIAAALRHVVDATETQRYAGKDDRYWALIEAHSALLKAKDATPGANLRTHNFA